MITTADEFFDAYVRDGVYDRDAGQAALASLQATDKAAFYRLMTSKEFLGRCIQLERQYPSLWGSSGTYTEMTEEQTAEIDALLDEADELEERAAHLRAQADALRETYEYGAHPDD